MIMRIKILQWNIWGREKVENILKLVKKINSDILCFQELMIGSAYNNGQDVAKIISEKTDFEYNFALAHKANDDGCILGNGIFSRFSIIKNSNFFIANSKN